MKIIIQQNANDQTKDFFNVDIVNNIVEDNASIEDSTKNKDDSYEKPIWKKCNY